MKITYCTILLLCCSLLSNARAVFFEYSCGTEASVRVDLKELDSAPQWDPSSDTRPSLSPAQAMTMAVSHFRNIHGVDWENRWTPVRLCLYHSITSRSAWCYVVVIASQKESCRISGSTATGVTDAVIVTLASNVIGSIGSSAVRDDHLPSPWAQGMGSDPPSQLAFNMTGPDKWFVWGLTLDMQEAVKTTTWNATGRGDQGPDVVDLVARARRYMRDSGEEQKPFDGMVMERFGGGRDSWRWVVVLDFFTDHPSCRGRDPMVVGLMWSGKGAGGATRVFMTVDGRLLGIKHVNGYGGTDARDQPAFIREMESDSCNQPL